MFNELPKTSALLEEYPYTPFDDPARNVAERLIALAHIGFNGDVWGASPDRIKRYWVAFNENIQGSANTNSLSIWWSKMTEGMVTKSITDTAYLHEKNLLLDPKNLSISVSDQAVLQIFRQETDYLIDRARMWVRVRQAKRKAAQETNEETA